MTINQSNAYEKKRKKQLNYQNNFYFNKFYNNLESLNAFFHILNFVGQNISYICIYIPLKLAQLKNVCVLLKTRTWVRKNSRCLPNSYYYYYCN